MSKSDIRLIQMNAYQTPVIKEDKTKDWVTYGKDNEHYKYLIDRKKGSPTNSAIIDTYSHLIYGRGLTNLNNNIEDFLKFKKMLSKYELKKIIQDFSLFTQASILISPKKGKSELPVLRHLPQENTAPAKVDKNNEIKKYYYSEDFKKAAWNKDLMDEYDVITQDNSDKKSLMIYPIRPYSSGMKYFSTPDYSAGLPYAMMEEEISNYYVSHIKNGLSFGYIIDVPDGELYSPEEKRELEKKIHENLTGSTAAGRFVINFKGAEASISIVPLEVNSSHKQWEYLTQESRQQIMTAHKVTSPMLFGIKDNTGLGNNADEMDVAEAQLIKRVVSPKQEYITDCLENIGFMYGLNLDLAFLPLTEVKITEEQATNQAKIQVGYSEQNDYMGIDAFVELGEVINKDEYEAIDIRDDYVSDLTENILHGVLNFARVPHSTPTKRSEHDTYLFKVRYEYAGSKSPQREFCRKVMAAGRSYRYEDIVSASNKVVNAGFGPNGANKYDIFLYKGGVNCKHFWQRKVYLRKNNKRISVNEARRMILELDPKERPDARLKVNPKQVAQIASPSNNHWKLK